MFLSKGSRHIAHSGKLVTFMFWSEKSNEEIDEVQSYKFCTSSGIDLFSATGATNCFNYFSFTGKSLFEMTEEARRPIFIYLIIFSNNWKIISK